MKQREILFRGVAIDNKKWVEGFYFHSMEEENPRIMTVIHDGGNCFDEPPSDHEEAIKVFPNTICQYIGREDINKKNIFEGDIVRSVDNCDKPLVGVIVFHNVGFIWKEKFHGFLFLKDHCKYEIIGTVFQNPELVEKYKLEI